MDAFTFGNLKGGCCKSTLFMQVGSELSNHGETWGIDTDPQESSYGLWLQLGGKEILGFTVKSAKGKNILDILEEAEHANIKYIIFDCPPKKDNDNDELANKALYEALSYTDIAITPVICSGVDENVLGNTYQVIENIKVNKNPDLKSVVILTHYSPIKLISKEVEKEILERGLKILPTKMAYRESYKLHKKINPWTVIKKPNKKDYKAITEIKSIVEDLLKLLK